MLKYLSTDNMIKFLYYVINTIQSYIDPVMQSIALHCGQLVIWYDTQWWLDRIVIEGLSTLCDDNINWAQAQT